MSSEGNIRTKDQLLSMFRDNNKGEITPQFLRDFVASIYNEVSLAEMSQEYVPESASNWNENPPTTIQQALDRLASFLASNIGPVP